MDRVGMGPLGSGHGKLLKLVAFAQDRPSSGAVKMRRPVGRITAAKHGATPRPSRLLDLHPNCRRSASGPQRCPSSLSGGARRYRAGAGGVRQSGPFRRPSMSHGARGSRCPGLASIQSRGLSRQPPRRAPLSLTSQTLDSHGVSSSWEFTPGGKPGSEGLHRLEIPWPRSSRPGTLQQLGRRIRIYRPTAQISWSWYPRGLRRSGEALPCLRSASHSAAGAPPRQDAP